MSRPLRIIFFGTPSFAERIFSCLVENHVNIIAVVTQPGRPKGRSSEPVDPPVKLKAKELLPSVPIFQPEKASTEDFANTLRDLNADLFLVVAYGEIIRQNILDIPKSGCINVHGSLLPKYRGAAPIQRCLMAGEQETGITIMFMALKMDAGDIIASNKIAVPEEMTCGELSEKLSELACPLLLKVLHDLEKGGVQRIPQDHSKATFAPKITPEDTEIHWERKAQEIHNQIRALSPGPGAWCWVQTGNEKKRLKIYRSHLKSNDKNFSLSKTILSYTPQEWLVVCEEGVLQLLEVQLEGKKKLSISEFVRGIPKPLLL